MFSALTVLAQAPVHARLDLGAVALVVVGVVLLIGIAVALHAWLRGTNRSLGVKSALTGLLNLVWIAPVVLVLLWLGARADIPRESPRGVDSPATVEEIDSPRPPIQPTLPDGPVAEVNQSDVPALPVADVELENAQSETAQEAQPAAESRFVAHATELPDWVREGNIDDGQRQLVIVSSSQHSTINDAGRDALEQAAAALKADFNSHTQNRLSWTFSPATAEHVGVRKRFIQEITRYTEKNPFVVYRAYYQVELSPQVRDSMSGTFRTQIVEKRLAGFGGVLGFVTLILVTVTAYLRLDTLTQGNYRGRLKTAAVALLVAVGSLIAMNLA